MCSSVFGHARFPSLVMCQIMKMAVLVVFAYATKSSLIYFTCVMLPDVPAILFECMTEMESRIRTSEVFHLSVSRMSSIQLSQSIIIFSHLTQSLFALALI